MAQVSIHYLNGCSEEAAWSCTTCGFCLEACPVGNEPMVDILRMRQDLVLMGAIFHETPWRFLIKLKIMAILGVCPRKIEKVDRWNGSTCDARKGVC